MDRTKALSRIYYLGPTPGYVVSRGFYDGPEYCFVWNRKLSHRLGSVTGRKFTLKYITKDRAFICTGTRRVSKRRKREPVDVSEAMTKHLTSLLPKEEIARCVASSMTMAR